MEKKLFNYFDELRGSYTSHYQTVNELKVMSFIAVLAKRGYESACNIDFTDHTNFREDLLKLSDELEDRTSSLVKDVIVTGIFSCCSQLDVIYKDMLTLTEEELLELNNILYLDRDNKYTREAGIRITKDSIVELVYKLNGDKNNIKVLDLCSGEGGFLSYCAKNNPSNTYEGYEINSISKVLSSLRLELLNVNYLIKEENVLSVKMENKYDLVFSEYPWGVRPTNQVVSDDNGYVEYHNSKSKADWAFINKAINSMNLNGKSIVLANGAALFGMPDKQSREQVVDKRLLESIIALPSGILPWTSVNSYLLVFSHDNKKVKFVDAGDCYNLKNKEKTLAVENILELVSNEENETCVKVVSYDEIRENDYNLNVFNYVGQEEINLVNPHKLDDVAEVITGFQYTTKTVEELPAGEGNVIVVKGTNISSGEVDLDNAVTINIDDKKVSKYLLRTNDILITTKGTSINMAIVPDMNGEKVIPNNILTIIRVKNNEINPVYLFTFFKSATGMKLLNKLQNGAIILNITRKSLLEMDIPVVDIDTQEVIANKYHIFNEQLKEAREKVNMLTHKINSIYEEEASI